MGRNAGEVVLAGFGLRCTIHQEMEDEIGFAGQLVACGLCTPDKQIAGGEDLGDPHSATCAGLNTKNFLSGYVGGDLLIALYNITIP